MTTRCVNSIRTKRLYRPTVNRAWRVRVNTVSITHPVSATNNHRSRTELRFLNKSAAAARNAASIADW